MVFLVAVSALFVFIAANGLALATLFGASWKTTIVLVARRQQLSRFALYSIPIAAVGRHVLLGLDRNLNNPIAATVVSTVVGGILPLLAYNKASRVLEGFEIRDIINGRE